MVYSLTLQLADVGLELTFVLDGMLLPEVGRILQDHIDLQLEAVKHRAAVSTPAPQ